MPFSIPMVWREEKLTLRTLHDKSQDKHYVQYSDFISAIRQIPHDPDLPVPKPDGNINISLIPNIVT